MLFPDDPRKLSLPIISDQSFKEIFFKHVLAQQICLKSVKKNDKLLTYMYIHTYFSNCESINSKPTFFKHVNENISVLSVLQYKVKARTTKGDNTLGFSIHFSICWTHLGPSIYSYVGLQFSNHIASLYWIIAVNGLLSELFFEINQ